MATRAAPARPPRPPHRRPSRPGRPPRTPARRASGSACTSAASSTASERSARRSEASVMAVMMPAVAIGWPTTSEVRPARTAGASSSRSTAQAPAGVLARVRGPAQRRALAPAHAAVLEQHLDQHQVPTGPRSRAPPGAHGGAASRTPTGPPRPRDPGPARLPCSPAVPERSTPVEVGDHVGRVGIDARAVLRLEAEGQVLGRRHRDERRSSPPAGWGQAERLDHRGAPQPRATQHGPRGSCPPTGRPSRCVLHRRSMARRRQGRAGRKRRGLASIVGASPCRGADAWQRNPWRTDPTASRTCTSPWPATWARSSRASPRPSTWCCWA